MKRLGAFMLVFRLFTGMDPSWVYVDDGKIHYLFEVKNKRLVQGGISIGSYRLPYTDSVVVSVEGRERVYRGEIHIKVDKFGKLHVENHITLEDAVKAIVSTIPIGDRNGELLKLKSIIARTILLYFARAKKIIPDSTKFFVYTGREREMPIASFASKFTTGAFLTKDDSLIIPFYHINSGGITESGEEMNCGVDYLVSNIDTFAKFGKNFEWIVKVSKDSLYSLLKTRTIIPFKFTSSGRVLSFIVDNEEVISAHTVSEVLNLPSLLIYVEEGKDTVFIYGRGKGSGLGISLESADYMTTTGMSYIDVIKFFYNGKVDVSRRFKDEELYRIPLVQYPKEAGACSHY